MLEKILFKTVELWVVLVLALVGVVITLTYGWAVYHQARGEAGLGIFGRVALHLAALPERAITAAKMEDPYLASENRFPGQSGFKFSYPPNTRPDSPFVLVSRHDADRELGVSELWDLNTQKRVAIQTWNVDPVWAAVGRTSDLENFPVDKRNSRYAPYHTLLTADGRMISEYDTPLIEADACGAIKVLNKRYIFHHSIEQDADGNLWVPATLEPKTVDLGDDRFLDDGLVEISPSGKLLFEKSVSQILMDNGLGYWLTGGNDFIVNDDPIHLNDIQPVLQDGPYYKKGDVFVSLRHLSLVMLYRPSTNKIIWYTYGHTSHQHDVDILSDHEIAVFDNNTSMRKGIRVVDGNNEYLVYDFETGKFTQRFGAALRAEEVRTPTDGRSELLPDGTLFVEESEFGRLLNLTPDGKVNWSYVNRDKHGDLIKLTWSRIIPRDLAEKFLSARKEAVCE